MDQERKIMLGRLQGKFAQLIDDIIKDRVRFPHLNSKKDIAAHVGIDRPILSRLTKEISSNEYHTELSNTYLMPFITEGAIMTDQIMDTDAKVGKVPPRERAFWHRAKLQEAINEMDALGVDPIEVLQDKIKEYRQIRAKISKQP